LIQYKVWKWFWLAIIFSIITRCFWNKNWSLLRLW